MNLPEQNKIEIKELEYSQLLKIIRQGKNDAFHYQCMYELGSRLFDNNKNIRTGDDLKQVLPILIEAADNNCIDAIHRIIILAMRYGLKETLLDYIIKGSELNDTTCISLLADYYYTGMRQIKTDHEKAFELYKRSYELGDDPSINLAIIYGLGLGTSIGTTESIKILE